MGLLNKDTLSGVVCGYDTLILEGMKSSEGNLSLLTYQAELLKPWHFQFAEINANLSLGVDSSILNFTASFRFELVQTPQWYSAKIVNFCQTHRALNGFHFLLNQWCTAGLKIGSGLAANSQIKSDSVLYPH